MVRIHVSRSVWNGQQTDPKTQESKNAVPVISKLAAILAEHRKGQGNPISGWIFPNGAGKAPDPNNILQRVTLSALNVCGHCSKPEQEHNARTCHAIYSSRSGALGTHSGAALGRILTGWDCQIKSSRESSAIPMSLSRKPLTSGQRTKTARASMEKFETLTATQNKRPAD